MKRVFSHFLVVAFAVSVVSWAFNNALMADLLFDTADVHASADTRSIDHGQKPLKSEAGCNHGCHMFNHFQGQLSDDLGSFVLNVRAITFQSFARAFSSLVLQTQLRPPRLSFRI